MRISGRLERSITRPIRSGFRGSHAARAACGEDRVRCSAAHESRRAGIGQFEDDVLALDLVGDSQPASFYLDPENFATSVTIKSFMAAADQAAARDAIGAASATGLAVVPDAVATKADAGAMAAALAERSLVGHGHDLATANASGFMGASDKSKLNGIAAGAQVNRSYASEAQARAGTAQNVDMNPLRVGQAIQELGSPVGLHTGTGTNATNFPLVHSVNVIHGTPTDRNSIEVVRLDSGSSHRYTIGGSGAMLAGTWNGRGRDGSLNGSSFQRTA